MKKIKNFFKNFFRRLKAKRLSRKIYGQCKLHDNAIGTIFLLMNLLKHFKCEVCLTYTHDHLMIFVNQKTIFEGPLYEAIYARDILLNELKNRELRNEF